jgi:hypothetical protein
LNVLGRVNPDAILNTSSCCQIQELKATLLADLLKRQYYVALAIFDAGESSWMPTDIRTQERFDKVTSRQIALMLLPGLKT